MLRYLFPLDSTAKSWGRLVTSSTSMHFRRLGVLSGRQYALHLPNEPGTSEEWGHHILLHTALAVLAFESRGIPSGVLQTPIWKYSARISIRTPFFLRHFVVFFSPSRKMPAYYLDYTKTAPFKSFPIHEKSYHPSQYCLATDCVENNRKLNEEMC
jgi:hypothetical protein